MSMQVEQINMITQQLKTGNITSQSIIDLYGKIPRDAFMPTHLQRFAYSDLQLDLPHQQRMMTPLEEATLLQALHLSGTETVLEVGTGSGFLTALLSQLCKKVISIEFFQDVSSLAKEKLQKHQCHNVELFTGNACNGWFDAAPYDVIILTGAVEALSQSHRLQVVPGGKLFAIVGKAPVMQGQLHQLDHNGRWSVQILFETCLPPLIDPLKSPDFIF
jgi:protein-L-isoaspartate(D-aspartate) O-methyltransferase